MCNIKSSCIIKGCSRPNAERLFSIPKNEEKLHVWLEAMNMEYILELSAAKRHHIRICARHFTRNHFSDYRMCKLNRNAIPNQHLGDNIVVDINRVFIPTAPQLLQPNISEATLRQNLADDSCNNFNFVYEPNVDTSKVAYVPRKPIITNKPKSRRSKSQPTSIQKILADIIESDSNNASRIEVKALRTDTGTGNTFRIDTGTSNSFRTDSGIDNTFRTDIGMMHVSQKPILLNPHNQYTQSPLVELQLTDITGYNSNVVDKHDYCAPLKKENLIKMPTIKFSRETQTLESLMTLERKTAVVKKELCKLQKIVRVTKKKLLKDSAIQYIETSCGLSESAQIFVKSQMNSMRGEWGPQAKHLFLGLFRKSTRAYKHLQTLIKCPSIRTLLRFESSMSSTQAENMPKIDTIVIPE